MVHEYTPLFAYGKLRNYHYDSILIGSSVSDLYSTKGLNRVFNDNFVHLNNPGGTAHSYKLVLGHAFKVRGDIKRIVYVLDHFFFSGTVDRLRVTRSNLFFYYDPFYLSAIKYLTDSNMLFLSLDVIISQIIKKDYKRILYGDGDGMETFTPALFNAEAAIDSFNKKLYTSRGDELDKFYNDNAYNMDVLRQSFEFNLLQMIKTHGNTKFIIIYPPYSILEFVLLERKYNKSYHTFLDFKCYINTTLSSYDNVEIYDFQNERNITEQLNRYQDVIHHDRATALYIINNLTNDKYRVKKTGACVRDNLTAGFSLPQ
ncbi:MAG: hypothetical protein H7844_13880 [Nitrospirae bacterium YQR-1]